MSELRYVFRNCIEEDLRVSVGRVGGHVCERLIDSLFASGLRDGSFGSIRACRRADDGSIAGCHVVAAESSHTIK